MSLLGKALVFVLIGCACSQNFGQMGRDMDGHMQNLGSNMDQFGDNFQYGNPGGFSNNRSPAGMSEADIQNVMRANFERLAAELVNKCKKANKPDVVEALPRLMETASTCIQQQVDVSKIQEEFAQAARTSNLNAFLKKNCGIWPSVNNCIKPFVTSIKKCLYADEINAIDKSIDIISSSNDFFCENDAHRIIEFITEGGFQCYGTAQAGLTNCISQVASNRPQKTDDKLLVTYDEQDCGDYNTLRKCFVKELSTCSSKSPSKITDEYLELIGKKVCSSATSLTWFSFVNVALILVSYLYSKMF